MPNYCENKITFSGAPKDVKIAFSYLGSDKEVLDFNKVIPYPQHFREKDEQREKLKEEGDYEKYRNFKDGYNNGGYEWCIANWGTKWNAISPVRTGNTITFDTAWSPPTPIVAKIHEHNPNVSMVFSYREPGMCFAGREVYTSQKESTTPAGTPSQSDHWEGEDYHDVHPEDRLALYFEEALFEPENPSNLLSRDQLTKREDETAVAAIKELTKILASGCYHGELGVPTEKDIRFELTKLGNTLKVLIDSKFEKEINDVIKAVAAAESATLLEKESSIMPIEDPKPGKKKLVTPVKTYLTLEQAKDKILSIALNHKDSTGLTAGFDMMSVMGELEEKDHDGFMDYLSSTEFEDALQELSPKISELSVEELTKQLDKYREVAPYKKGDSGDFVYFMTASSALGTAMGKQGYSVTQKDILSLVLEMRTPYNGGLLDNFNQFEFPEDCRSKFKDEMNTGAKRLSAWANWTKFETLLQHPGQIPEELQADLQSALLRVVLGYDKHPRMGTSHYSDSQVTIRKVVSNTYETISYADVCKVWEGFLRSYIFLLRHRADSLFLLRHRAVANSSFNGADSIGDFIITGRLNQSILKMMEEVESICWHTYITERIFQAIKSHIAVE